jgi:Xaa-Pro aminopeptidase
MKERLADLRSELDSRDLGCMLVTKMENVRYLSGFSGSNAVALVTPAACILITDGRYRDQAQSQVSGWEIRIYTGSIFKEIADAVPPGGHSGFEVTCGFDFHRELSAHLEGVDLEPLEGVVERLRAVKDTGEVERIRAALRCAASAFEAVRGTVKAGVSEREIAAELDYRMMLAGADGPAFDTVVSSGANSAMPHAPLTDRIVADGDMVVVDFGAVLNGYVSDTTRTFLLPGAGQRAREMFGVVSGALQETVNGLKPGMKACDAEDLAHGQFDEAGFGEYWSHSLGHGVGLEVHETPTLSAVSTDVLEPGMVFTVEPGAYIKGFGGVRIEELVLMTQEGPELLSADIKI